MNKDELFFPFIEKRSKREKELISQIEEEIFKSLFLENRECESPIERLFSIALRYVMFGSKYDFEIEPQKNIEVLNKEYRVDFFICGRELKDELQIRSLGLIVECEGHKFHEKTKEQARNDKKRERKLIKAGYPVIRYTGSEIFDDPIECARETLEIFDYLIKRKKFEKCKEIEEPPF